MEQLNKLNEQEVYICTEYKKKNKIGYSVKALKITNAL